MRKRLWANFMRIYFLLKGGCQYLYFSLNRYRCIKDYTRQPLLSVKTIVIIRTETWNALRSKLESTAKLNLSLNFTLQSTRGFWTKHELLVWYWTQLLLQYTRTCHFQMIISITKLFDQTPVIETVSVSRKYILVYIHKRLKDITVVLRDIILKTGDEVYSKYNIKYIK